NGVRRSYANIEVGKRIDDDLGPLSDDFLSHESTSRRRKRKRLVGSRGDTFVVSPAAAHNVGFAGGLVSGETFDVDTGVGVEPSTGVWRTTLANGADDPQQFFTADGEDIDVVERW